MSLFANTRFAFSLFACATLACAQETEPLCAAAARRDLAEVRRLLDRGANPDARDSKGRTALILAMQGSASEYKVVPPSEDIARILIERGAAINVRDTEGWTPLLMLLAQFAGSPKLLDLLLQKGADVNARRNDGITGLVFAARRPSVDVAQLLLDKGARIDAQDDRGATPLMYAVAGTRDGHQQMIELLLARGADVNLRDRQGHSTVDWGIEAGYPDRVSFLVDKGAQVADHAAAVQAARDRALVKQVGEGANVLDTRSTGGDPNATGEQGRTVLMLAASHEFGDPLVKILLDKGARVNDRDSQGDNALLIAAGNYLPKIVRLLLEKGADVNARDKDGNTVLMRAAGSRRSWREDREPMFDMLLAAGADPKPANTRGVTALMLTAQEGNPGVLGLLEGKVRVDARDSGGNTALLYATRMFVGHGQRAAGRALLAAGADVNAANLDGETPLIRAATQYEEECAEILLERGANVNSRTQQGRTPLIAAIDGPKDFDNTNHLVYSPKIARLLIARGADVNARDAAGRTPLLLAVMRGHADIIPLLLEHKADVNVVDRNGDTVLTLAGSNEVIALLKKAGAQ